MSQASYQQADVAERLFFERWYAISVSDAEQIIAAAQALTDDELMLRPMLVTGAVVSVQLHPSLSSESTAADPEAASPTHAAGFERFAALMSRTPGLDALEDLPLVTQRRWQLMEMIAYRWAHQYDAALAVSSALATDPLKGSIKAVLFDEYRGDFWPGHLTLQRGITEALGGSFSTAMRLFRKAYDEGGEPPYWHFAKANAAANAALLLAVEGYDDDALDWLEKAHGCAPVPEQIERLTFLGSDIAMALLAVDAGELQRARMLLEPLEKQGAQFELWPFLLYALTQLDLANNKPIRAHLRFKTAGYTLDRISAIDTAADHLVFRGYLDTLLMLGEGGIALRLANQLGHPLRSLVPVARIHLYSGDFTRAARVAAQALRRAQLSGRDLCEATLIGALADLQLGNTDEALQRFSMLASSHPRHYGNILHSMPADLVAQFYAAAGEQTPHRAPGGDYVALPVPQLTARERQVLQLLAENITPKAIAVNECVSELTVRTHIKRIYKKLEVANKADAVMKAEKLGILSWFHLDGDNHVL